MLGLPVATIRLLLGLFFADTAYQWVSLKHQEGSKKAAVAGSIGALSRASTGCSGKSPAVVAPRIMSRIRGLAAFRAPRCAGVGKIARSFAPNTWVAGAECGLFRAVLSKFWKESFKRPLPGFTEDFGGFSFLKDCVTVHSENVVDSTDAKAVTEEGKFCLQVLTKLYVFMHGPDDICFRQKLV